MATEVENKPIYIVVSQTGTILSRILKIITHKEYNHVSVSLNNDLELMYSFGRKKAYNPFIAGFVIESVNFGTFKRFYNTKVVVLEVTLPNENYEKMKTLIDLMVSDSKKYRYNYWGLYLAALKIPYKSHNRYYCSEFVRDLLIKYNVDGAEELNKIVHPMSFLNLPETQTVYIGKLKDYARQKIA